MTAQARQPSGTSVCQHHEALELNIEHLAEMAKASLATATAANTAATAANIAAQAAASNAIATALRIEAKLDDLLKNLGDLLARIQSLETARTLANGVHKGRLEVVLVVAKIVALLGVGSGGIGALVAILKAALGGQ